MTEPKRLFDIPYYQLEKYNLQKAFTAKNSGNWESESSKTFIEKATALSRGLLRLGIKPNDKIAVISLTNRTEWNICDIGILQIGAQNVPIYPTISQEDYQYVLNHSQSVYCFVSCNEVLKKINAIKDQVPSLKGVYSFDNIKDVPNWKDVLALGENTDNQTELEARKDAIQETDLATLIYTSGTTGRPKGVMLTHKNIVSNVIYSTERLPIEAGNASALSFLPVCHIFERMILYLYMYNGVSIYFAESIDKISENMQEIKPNLMTVVPRLLEKIYDKIYAKGASLTGLKKQLFFWALNLGLKWEPYGQNGWWYETQLKLARKLIFKKWQEALGGNIIATVSGSAALQPR